MIPAAFETGDYVIVDLRRLRLDFSLRISAAPGKVKRHRDGRYAVEIMVPVVVNVGPERLEGEAKGL